MCVFAMRVKTATYWRDTFPEPQKTLGTNHPEEQRHHPNAAGPERKTRQALQRGAASALSPTGSQSLFADPILSQKDPQSLQDTPEHRAPAGLGHAPPRLAPYPPAGGCRVCRRVFSRSRGWKRSVEQVPLMEPQMKAFSTGCIWRGRGGGRLTSRHGEPREPSAPRPGQRRAITSTSRPGIPEPLHNQSAPRTGVTRRARPRRGPIPAKAGGARPAKCGCAAAKRWRAGGALAVTRDRHGRVRTLRPRLRAKT